MHDHFWEFKYGKANSDGFVKNDFLKFGFNYYKICINNYGPLVQKLTHSFEDLGGIGN